MSLRYKLVLRVNGMLDEPRSSMSTVEKFKLLTSHAAAWQQFHTVQPEYTASLIGWDTPAAISGNTIVFTRNCDGSEGECSPGPDVPIDDHIDVLVVRVGSPRRRIEGTQWMLYLPARLPVEICVDATQDLLIHVACVPFVRLHDGKRFTFRSFN